MKIQLLAFVIFLPFYTILNAQAPAACSYQAVARDQDGKALADQAISLQITLHRATESGTIAFREVQSDLQTNHFGLFNAQIGQGTALVSTFAQIDWAQGPYFLEIGLDPNNGNSFDLKSTTQILSVPYALYAAQSPENDGDPTNELQTLSLAGNVLTLSNGGGSVNIPGIGGGTYTAGSGIKITGNEIINIGDIDPANDITNTTPAGGSLSGIYPNPQIAPNAIGSTEIANGSITLNDLAAGVVPQKIGDLIDVNPAGVTTGQVLKWNGTAWVAAPDNTGGAGTATVSTTAPVVGDGSVGNAITLGQNGAAMGQVLKWNGTTWLPADDLGGATYTPGNGISINTGIITATDASATNELQNLTLAGQTLGLSNSGATVSLAPYLQTLTYDSVTQNLLISAGNTVQLNGLGNWLWKSTGLELEPKNATLGVNLPSGSFRGGGAKGWEFNNGGNGLYLFKPSGNGTNVALGGTAGLPDNGGISLFNQSNKQVVYLHADFADAGRLVTRAADGTTTTGLLGHGSGNQNEGEVHLFSNGEPVASLIATNGIGQLSLLKSDGHLLVDANQSGLDPQGGAIRVYSNDQGVGRMFAQDGTGTLLLSGQTNNYLVMAGQTLTNTGSISVWGPSGTAIGEMSGCGHGVGYLHIHAPSGKLVVEVAHTDGAHLENGFIGVHGSADTTNTASAGFWASDSEGNMFTDNAQARQIILDDTAGVWHTTLWKDANGGMALIRNSTGDPRVSLYVQNDKGIVAADNITANSISATIKNFRMDYPNDPTKEIYYACVEGPEAAAYERGTGKLVHGEVFVPYSEHFGLVINPATVTVQLTSNSTDTYGLAVVEKRATGFLVRELKGGQGDFTFDWEVKGVRQGYENYQAVRAKSAGVHPPADKKNDTVPGRPNRHRSE